MNIAGKPSRHNCHATCWSNRFKFLQIKKIEVIVFMKNQLNDFCDLTVQKSLQY